MPSQAEIIKFAGGLAPIVPFADYKRKFTTRKWILANRTVDCDLKTWKREDQLDISQPVLPLETPVITYTTEEYDKHLLHQFWTREETDELMQLASRFNLRFIIIHDQFSGNKTLEDLKLRYHQVNRILLGKRKEAVSEFNFDFVREQSRKQQLLKLLGRTEKQLKEEQMLFLELKDFERRRDAWNEKREHLYKIISHNAEATKSISDKSNSLKKKKFKRKEDMGGIYLSSSRLSFIRPSLQQKVF